MALLFVKRLYENEKASSKLSSDGIIEITETQHWQVAYSTAAEFSCGSALSASGLPTIGSAHPIITDMVCVGLEPARNNDSPNICDVTVTYQTLPASDDEGESGIWAINVSSKGISYTEDVHEDRNKAPIKNSAGQAFDPPAKKTYHDEEISVSYRCLPSAMDFGLFSDLRGKINNDEITLTIYGQTRTFPPKTLYMANADYSTAVGQGTRYYDCSLVLHYRSQLDDDGQEVGWTDLITDRGYLELNDDDELVPIKIKTGPYKGQEKTTFSYLDGEGHELAAGEQCVRLPFEIKDEAAFAPLLAGVEN
jgi:hypothetical protein